MKASARLPTRKLSAQMRYPLAPRRQGCASVSVKVPYMRRGASHALMSVRLVLCLRNRAYKALCESIARLLRMSDSKSPANALPVASFEKSLTTRARPRFANPAAKSGCATSR